MGLFDQLDPALMALWYAAFLLSTTVHEAAHAVAALRGGDTRCRTWRASPSGWL